MTDREDEAGPVTDGPDPDDAGRGGSDEYGWLLGSRAAYAPVESPDAPVAGEIVEVRDDDPSPGRESVRVVLDTGERLVDVGKDRVSLQ
jgi:hypothetical protein